MYGDVIYFSMKITYIYYKNMKAYKKSFDTLINLYFIP